MIKKYKYVTNLFDLTGKVVLVTGVVYGLGMDMAAIDFRSVIDVDLIGSFIVTKFVTKSMIERGRGRGRGKIINICSMMSELDREIQ